MGDLITYPRSVAAVLRNLQGQLSLLSWIPAASSRGRDQGWVRLVPGPEARGERWSRFGPFYGEASSSYDGVCCREGCQQANVRRFASRRNDRCWQGREGRVGYGNIGT